MTSEPRYGPRSQFWVEVENERLVDSRSDTITGQKFIIYQSSSIDELDRVSTRYCNDGKDEIPCELIDSFTTKNPSFLFKQIESFRYSNKSKIHDMQNIICYVWYVTNHIKTVRKIKTSKNCLVVLDRSFANENFIWRITIKKIIIK